MADKCPRCNGSGTITEPAPGGGEKQSTCPRCGGSGQK